MSIFVELPPKKKSPAKSPKGENTEPISTKHNKYKCERFLSDPRDLPKSVADDD